MSSPKKTLRRSSRVAKRAAGGSPRARSPSPVANRAQKDINDLERLVDGHGVEVVATTSARSPRKSASPRSPSKSPRKSASPKSSPKKSGRKRNHKKSTSTGEKKKYRHKHKFTNGYIRQFIRQEFPKMEVGKLALKSLGYMVDTFIEDVANEMNILVRSSRKKTVMLETGAAACMNVLTRRGINHETTKSAVTFGEKAAEKYAASKSGSKKNRVATATRAGLAIACGRVSTKLRDMVVKRYRVSNAACLVVCGVLEDFLVGSVKALDHYLTTTHHGVRLTHGRLTTYISGRISTVENFGSNKKRAKYAHSMHAHGVIPEDKTEEYYKTKVENHPYAQWMKKYFVA